MESKDTKKLILNLLSQEIKKYKVPVKILTLTPFENLLYILQTAITSHPQNIKELLALVEETKDEIYISAKTDAYYDYGNNKLKIILKQKKNIDEKHSIWMLLKNTYHEYKHTILEKLVKKPYIETKEDLFYAIENLIAPTDDFYLTYHDDFYEEIQANNYGIKKAEHFLQSNPQYKKQNQQLKNIITLDKLLHETYYRNYDFQLILAKVNSIIKENIHEINKYLNDKELAIVKILYKKSGKFKTPSELIQTQNWNNMSKEAQYLIISSESYLTDIDYTKCSKEELYFILDALSYSLTLEYEKPKHNQDFRDKLNQISKELNEDDLGEINLYLDTLLVLNNKEQSNIIKINKLKILIEQITVALKPAKRKILNEHHKQKRT